MIPIIVFFLLQKTCCVLDPLFSSYYQDNVCGQLQWKSMNALHHMTVRTWDSYQHTSTTATHFQNGQNNLEFLSQIWYKQKTNRRRLKLKKYLHNVTNFIFSNQEERSCSSGGVFLSRHPCCLLHLERHWPVRDDPPVQQCEWGDQAVCQVSDAESQHPLHWSPRLRVVGATVQPISGKN